MPSALISKAHLVEDFRRIGLCDGDTVAVTLSLKSIGVIEGGADEFIDALLETVGEDGTIMMNAYTHTFPAGEISPNYIFDAATTTPYTGIAPKLLLKRKDAVRSTHPTCSVVAIGKNAKTLTERHNQNARPYLPYSLLAEIGGKYLAIGTGNNLVAIRHEAQYYTDLPRFLRHGVQYKNGDGETHLFVWDHPPCEKNLGALYAKLDGMGFMRHGKIGQANAVMMLAKDFIRNEAALLQENPALNQCNDILCLQCRETERRMNLYKDLSKPRFFQRSYLVRKTMQYRNYLVMAKKYNQAHVGNSNSILMEHLDFAFQGAAKRLDKRLT
jgi:aminoglycoside N3'-acetyltransferase